MTTVGMHYEVIAGKEKEFERSFEQVVGLLRTLPGHVDSRLYLDVSSVGSYVIISEWKKIEDFNAFIQSPAFKETTNWGKAEILRGRPRHKVYQS